MLLLLKTNDLLRGIETCLHTRNSSSSFIHMSKCCVKLIHSYEREQYKQSKASAFQRDISISDKRKPWFNQIESFVFDILKYDIISFTSEYLNLMKIYAFQIYLYIFNASNF
jgi:hypothetical protein